MSVITLGDMSRYLRCPYEFQLDRRSGVWRITAGECMDMSVRDAIMASEQRRLTTGKPMDHDAAMSFYWDSWDRHFPDVFPPATDTAGLIRFGERCVDNYLRISSPDAHDVVAVGVSGTLALDGGREVLVAMDSVRVNGPTATVCRYVCDPGIRSSDELASDRDMALCARWVLSNIRGCTRVRLRWEFLGSGTATEASARMSVMEGAMSYASDLVAQIEAEAEVLPRETDHCSECPYHRTCPRRLHEVMLAGDPSKLSTDEGVRLVDEYVDLQDKIDALKRRQQELEARRDAVGEGIVAYADANGFMSVSGRRAKALVRHERKVELPEDKTEVIETLRRRGLYDDLSMPNYPRLRSDIARGLADPEISRLATITESGKVYLRRKSR